jgi:hypothetical protein
VCLVALGHAPSVGEAQPDSGPEIQLQAARGAYLEAQFPEARDLLRDLLEHAERLTRSRVVEALALEAMVHFAMRDEPATRRALRQLAVVAPDHRWSEEAPPPIRDQWTLERMQVEEPTVDAHAVRHGTQVRIEGAVSGDLAGLVDRWELRARAGTQPWVVASHPLVVEFENPHSATYEVELRALGPGDVTLRTVSRQLQVVSGAVLGAGPEVGATADGDARTRRRQRWILSAASVLLFSAVVAGVAIRVSRIQPSPSTELQGPFFE